jgi:hypothetical protein
MPAFRYSIEHEAFTKSCCRCQEVFVGTSNIEESLIIFRKHFGLGDKNHSRDGLKSRCRGCSQSKRRALGITRDMLNELFDKQSGRCAICMKDVSIEVGADTSVHAHVDHNDDSGEVRGLLCALCNRGIGFLRHDPTILSSAIKYLTKDRQIVKLVRRI